MTLSAHQLDAIRAAARRAVYRYVRNPQASDVDDLSQDVAVKAWEHRSSFDPSLASYATWVLTIARRTLIDQGLKKKPLPLAEGFDAAVEEVEADAEVERAALEVRRLLPKAPIRTRVVLSSMDPAQFPPTEDVKAAFARLFGVSWEASRGDQEWSAPTPEFLAARARLPKNTLIDQPLRRLRLALAKDAPALARLLRNSRQLDRATP